MDGRRGLRSRRIGRRVEANRFEEVLWTLAYEQIWPQFREVVNHPRPASHNKSHSRARGAASTARRA